MAKHQLVKKRTVKRELPVIFANQNSEVVDRLLLYSQFTFCINFQSKIVHSDQLYCILWTSGSLHLYYSFLTRRKKWVEQKTEENPSGIMDNHWPIKVNLSDVFHCDTYLQIPVESVGSWLQMRLTLLLNGGKRAPTSHDAHTNVALIHQQLIFLLTMDL